MLFNQYELKNKVLYDNNNIFLRFLSQFCIRVVRVRLN